MDTQLEANPKSTARSRLSNGSEVLPGVDGRSVYVRTMKAFMADMEADLGGDVSTAQHAIVRRAAALEVELVRLEQDFALAGQAEAGALDLYQRTANSQRRLLETVGIERKARDITPDLRSYVASKVAAAPGTTA